LVRQLHFSVLGSSVSSRVAAVRARNAGEYTRWLLRLDMARLGYPVLWPDTNPSGSQVRA